jgi:lysine 2,3-aminomutase
MKTHDERITELVAKMKQDNPEVVALFLDQKLDDAALVAHLREHFSAVMQQHYPKAWAYYTREEQTEQDYYKLMSTSMAYLRIMDYLDHEGQAFEDGNLHGQKVVSHPIGLLRSVLLGKECSCTVDFVEDMAHLLAQLSGVEEREIPPRSRVLEWMERHPSGLDQEVIAWRAKNKERIVQLLIERIEDQEKPRALYQFKEGMTAAEKRKQVLLWWKDDRFHLHFAIRNADDLNRYLDYSMEEKTLGIMRAVLSLPDRHPPA